MPGTALLIAIRINDSLPRRAEQPRFRCALQREMVVYREETNHLQATIQHNSS